MKLWPMPVIAVEARTRVVVRSDVATWNVYGSDPPYCSAVIWRWANQRRFFQHTGTGQVFGLWE